MHSSDRKGFAGVWGTISENPLWAALIATLVATLVAAFIVARTGSLFSASPSPQTAPDPTPTAVVSLSPTGGIAVIPKPIADVSTPPAYSSTETDDHCEPWWKGWFQQEHAASLNLPPFVSVSAPTGASITITHVFTHVFRAYKPSGVSDIECLSGAGPIPGTIVTLDLDHPSVRPTVATAGGNNPMPLPEAAININPGHTEYLSLVPHGVRGFYEWSATLEITVDQRTTSHQIGSSSHPLRSWLGFGSARTVNAGYDYSVATHSWRLLSPPSCVEDLDTCPPATPSGPAAKESPTAVFAHLIPDGARACGNGIGVNSGYGCEIAQTVVETMKASDPPATGRIAIVVHYGLLKPLPMECTIDSTADVCRSTDEQNLTVALLH